MLRCGAQRCANDQIHDMTRIFLEKIHTKLPSSQEWEDAQSSWFSKSSPGAFVLRDQMRQALLRALPSGSQGGLRLCDALGRLIAMAEPMKKGEGLKLEVKSETTTDLGLLTLASLAIHSFSETEDAIAL